MSDTSDKSKPENSLSLDLSQLQDLSIGPDWSDAARSAEARKNKQQPSARSGKGPSRDRRPDRPPRKRDFGGDQPGGERRDSRGGPRQGGPRGERRGGPRGGDRRQETRAPFKPIVDVAFYPEDAPFKALCHAMRSNCRTYELFEIARLILEKADRFVVVLHPKKDEGPQEFYVSVPDGLPFSSEDQAVAHVLKNHLDKFVDLEEVEAEPPSGNFPVVNKCGVTGELIGPPNYHRYQSLLTEHHAMNVPNMPFEKFTSRIESVRDEEVVNQWLEKMRKETRYKLKTADELVESFDNLESLKFYLLSKRKAEIVRTTHQARFSGQQAELLPRGPLKDSIDGWREQQTRFPLETANNLRGRLRRMHFTIYKRGSKGASFVCAVKRKFRNSSTRLAESLQELMDFIEKHPNIEVTKLPEEYLGIDVSAKTIEPPQEKAPDIESVPEEEAAKIVEAHEQKRAAKQAEAEAEAKSEEPVEAQPAKEAKPVAPAKPAVDHLEDPQLRQMMFDLRWLVTEGYVTEYGDGRLFAPPPMEESSAKPDKPAGEKKPKPETPAEPEAKAEPAEESTKAEEPKPEATEESTDKPEAKVAEESTESGSSDEPESEIEREKSASPS
ncbi:hypothetical protein [Cerasicoccus fimbriatus]|uniref:hypothetical protein n=1 Tax=Cerasicoccus fimbriatus TaxID=3014554 RepID=UPI0022B5CE52|nr:hypothetical protein [Cerasicoccus sp. TK19100]